MDFEQLNNTIKNYLDNDKTNSAIMLTGEWGSGKSYYIRNELLPYIEKDGDKKCIVVSLYGISDIAEINKNIYLELRAKMLSKKSEKISSGKLIAKTIVKGVTSFFGVDLSVSEKDLNNLYSSVDLTGKLIVLEDVERSSIDIKEILGYVNSLVEQDGVKVLLVANEQEIYKYEEIVEEKDGKKNIKKVFSSDTLEYLKIKEKTINDTIYFMGNYIETIENIMRNFSNKYFDLMIADKNILGYSNIADEIRYAIMTIEVNSYNFRSFIFGCQKVVDLLNGIDFDLDIDFVRALFLGVIIFAFKHKKNVFLCWEDDKSITSTTLGSYKYPLYKIAYDYVVFQQKDKKLLEASNRNFIEQRDALLKKNAVSEVLNVIYNYYELNEEDVVSAVISTCDFLEKDDIPYSEYLKLSNYLISLKYVVECYDLVDKCKNFMIQNIRKASMQNNIKLLHNSGIELHTEDEQKEFAEFEKELKDIADSDNRQWQDYNYTVEEFDEFYGKISKREDRFLSDRAFMQKIDVDKLLQLIPLLETSQISKLRSVFLGRYGYANINEFFMLEKPYLEQLKQGLEELLKQGAFEDKIKANQIKWFISNLENFILKLNK